MDLELLRSPLDKGESWEEEQKRNIQIVESSDNRGAKPNIYFGITKKKGKKIEITEDFFLTTKDAIKIGKELIRLATNIDRKW